MFQPIHYRIIIFSGQTKKHVEVIEERVDLFVERGQPPGSPLSETFRSLLPDVFAASVIPVMNTFDNTTFFNPTLNRFQPQSFTGLNWGQDTSYRAFLNNIEELCPLWIAKCRLVSFHACPLGHP